MRVAQFLLILSALFITGCAANGPPFSRMENSDPNKALIYIYRCSGASDFDRVLDVYIDEEPRGRLLYNGYLAYALDPGKRVLTVKNNVLGHLTIYPDLIEGHEYYFRWSYNSHGLVVRECRLEAIPSEIAIEEIKDTKRSD